jgi:hypothetical protein
VGGLAHLLKNRFYIGEVVYRGGTFRGDHEPILDPALFAAVQAKLATQAVGRRCRIRGGPALLTGRLFDEQGRRMTPTHTNKKGVRYSYYVSQAVLRKQPPGSIGRVPAPELEAVVVDAVRRHLQANGTAPNPILETDRELIERHLLRATLGMKVITLHLRQEIADSDCGPQDVPAAGSPAAVPTKVTIPWTVGVLGGLRLSSAACVLGGLRFCGTAWTDCPWGVDRSAFMRCASRVRPVAWSKISRFLSIKSRK